MELFVYVCICMCMVCVCIEVVLWSEKKIRWQKFTSDCFENGEAQVFGFKYGNHMIFLFFLQWMRQHKNIYIHQTQCDLCAFRSLITNKFDVKHLHFVCFHYIQYSHKYNSINSINKIYIYLFGKKKLNTLYSWIQFRIMIMFNKSVYRISSFGVSSVCDGINVFILFKHISKSSSNDHVQITEAWNS